MEVDDGSGTKVTRKKGKKMAQQLAANTSKFRSFQFRNASFFPLSRKRKLEKDHTAFRHRLHKQPFADTKEIASCFRTD
jgi:hypothetical protein